MTLADAQMTDGGTPLRWVAGHGWRDDAATVGRRRGYGHDRPPLLSHSPTAYQYPPGNAFLRHGGGPRWLCSVRFRTGQPGRKAPFTGGCRRFGGWQNQPDP
jgi:hypothetical protein